MTYPDGFSIRMPAGLRDEIKKVAKANGHSMNTEVVNRLSGSPDDMRDRFAMAALPSIIARCAGDTYQIATYPTQAAYFAAKAYEVADAMLAARKGGDA